MFFTAEPGAATELKQLGSIESRNGTLQVLVKPSGPPRGSRGPKNSEQRPSFNPTRVSSDDDIPMQEDSKETIVVGMFGVSSPNIVMSFIFTACFRATL